MTMQKILNGIVGHHLEATRNEWATEMTLYNAHHCPLSLRDIATITTPDDPSSPLRVCILVHGLVANEGIWLQQEQQQKQQQDDDDNDDKKVQYGTQLHRDLGFVPLYLRYNTGLHISTNGQQLNRLLQKTFCDVDVMKKKKTCPEIVFLCHSMGGLVVRSACSYGLDEEATTPITWTQRVSHVVFLGTPHQGSYWEKAGNFLTHTMQELHHPCTKMVAQVGNLRSDGIKDLRYGYVRAEDWNKPHANPDHLLWTNTKTIAATLLDQTRYHVVTGTATDNPNDLISKCFGDWLVHKLSAQGHSQTLDHHLIFDDYCEFPGVAHIALAHHGAVYEKIREWLTVPLPSSSSLSPRNDVLSFKEPVSCREPSGTNGDHAAVSTDPNAKSKYAYWKGTSSLVHDAVGAGVVAVGQVQRDLTANVYSKLSSWIPLLGPVTIKQVQCVHETAVDAVYASILTVNETTRAVTRYTINEVERRQQEQECDQQETTANTRNVLVH